jgi:hypothetical protein
VRGGGGGGTSGWRRIECPAQWGGKGAQEVGEAARPAALQLWGRMGRPEVEDTPDRWVPPVGERERGEKRRWADRVLLGREMMGRQGG